MKKSLSVLLVLCMCISLCFALISCETENSQSNTSNNNELYSKAIAILDEFSEDQRIKDFRNAYDLLMTLPSNEDKFILQLKKVNEIYKKYGVEFHSGSYYLKPKNTISISQEGINKYRANHAYDDAFDLMQAIVYPVLFEKYGYEAQSIKGITAPKILNAIKSTNDYTLYKKTEEYDGYKEVWQYDGIGSPKTEYEINYHKNGLIESITVPIVINDTQLSDDQFIAFLDKDAETQKRLAGSRFTSMLNQFSTIFTGYEVLSQIFTDEEITIISNYIHSLTVEEIWKRNLYAIGGEPRTYIGSIVMVEYKGNSIAINYHLNDISLRITGKNYVNALSHRWYTLWCGLAMGDNEEAINSYTDYINNNISSNYIIPDFSFDLDTYENQFLKPSN